MTDDVGADWKKITFAKTNDEWQMASVKIENVESSEPVESLVCEFDPFRDTEPGSSGSAESTGGVPTTSPKRKTSADGTIANETPEQRARRLANMSAYAARRLARESPEDRAARLARMSAYAARRLATETAEQRATRLARMSAYAARRLALETPEKRAARLKRMSEYAARRHRMQKQKEKEKSLFLIEGDANLSAQSFNGS